MRLSTPLGLVALLATLAAPVAAQGPVLTLSNGQPAFVEVAGPGGSDPCGPAAVSTAGCDEVGGNGIYGSFNSTGAYTGYKSGPDGPETSLPAFAPNDYEIRFTAAGSYGYYVFTTGAVTWVPFEVWDIGDVPPGAVNDPSDDVRMIPVLFADAVADRPEAEAECVFEYGGPTIFGNGAITQRIYAYYAAGESTYADWEAALAPLVAADAAGCPTSEEAIWMLDVDRKRPIQRFVLEQTDAAVGLADLEGTVIRFYTTDPLRVAADSGPDESGLALSVHPNPVRDAAAVPFEIAAAGPVRLSVVDVLGREVALLADGDRAAGEHRAAFDASRLPAGVYVVVLEAGGARTARTLTVAR